NPRTAGQDKNLAGCRLNDGLLLGRAEANLGFLAVTAEPILDPAQKSRAGGTVGKLADVKALQALGNPDLGQKQVAGVMTKRCGLVTAVRGGDDILALIELLQIIAKKPEQGFGVKLQGRTQLFRQLLGGQKAMSLVL